MIFVEVLREIFCAHRWDAAWINDEKIPVYTVCNR